MRRGWLWLAALGLVISAAGCGGHSQAVARGGEFHRSPSVSGTAAQMPARSAAPSATSRAGPALAGSFLMDLTWVNDQRGWALAAASCSKGLCPRVAATRDGGRTWTALPAPPAVIQDQNGVFSCAPAGCVSQIRFATPEVGYLFGPGLYQTSDGGRTWRRLPSQPVEALEPSAGTVVRITYDHTGCPGPCTRTVQETTAGSDAWHTLLRIPALPTASDSRAILAQAIRQGTSVIYIPVYGNLAAGAGTQHTVIFRSTDGGNSWQQLADPCGGAGQNVHDTAGLAAAPGGYLAVLCVPRAGSGPTFVLTSDDYGTSWSPPRLIPGETRNNLSLIAAASPARLVVSTGWATGGGPFTYRLAVTTDSGLRWSTAITGTTQINPQSPGYTFLGFEDSQAGRWISDTGHIWTTHDGGLHWLQRAFP